MTIINVDAASAPINARCGVLMPGESGEYASINIIPAQGLSKCPSSVKGLAPSLNVIFENQGSEWNPGNACLAITNASMSVKILMQ